MEVSYNNSKYKIRNLSNIVSNAIHREGSYRTRILYAGPHPEDDKLIALFRVVELLKGYYFLEETVFNPQLKSSTTTLSSLSKYQFHKVKTPGDLMHEIEFSPNPQIISGVSYSRYLNYKSLQNILIADFRTNKSWLSSICDVYLHYRIKNYLNKKA